MTFPLFFFGFFWFGSFSAEVVGRALRLPTEGRLLQIFVEPGGSLIDAIGLVLWI